ncbi:MAG: hypothetical protein K2O15_15015, partial [Lachnospiraceae bacterium]|nr:hypothetical protein [Lachnospiraceae bacterium]
ILVIPALLILTLLAGCAPSQTGEAEEQEGQEEQEEEEVQQMQEEQEVQEKQEMQEEQNEQEEQSDMLMSGEEFARITNCLDEQVPEIWDEWAYYVEDKTGGEAYLYERMAGEYSSEDVYRDYEKTEYLGKYYGIYVGEMWEDHSVNWAYFYVSENCDEVLWYDHIARVDNEYPVLYLDEWRNSEFYPKLGR